MKIRSKPFKVHASLCQFGAIRLAMTTEVIEDDTLIFCKFIDLIFEEFMVTGPAMDENQRFAVSMLFIIDLTVVFCRKISHIFHSFH